MLRQRRAERKQQNGVDAIPLVPKEEPMPMIVRRGERKATGRVDLRRARIHLPTHERGDETFHIRRGTAEGVFVSKKIGMKAA